MVISFFQDWVSFGLLILVCRSREVVKPCRGFASIDGDSDRAIFRIGFIWIVRAEWRILKKVILLGSV